MSCSPAFLAYLNILLLWGQVNSQLSCSDYNSTSNRYYLPNFGGRENVLDQIWESSFPGVTYIYPDILTNVNCSGIIKEVEFCYRINSSGHYDSNQLVFYLSILKQNHSDFTMLESYVVFSSPNAAKCKNIQASSLGCCDIITLGSGFMLSPSTKNISISISIPGPNSSNFTLQGFHSTIKERFVRVYLVTNRPTSTQFHVLTNENTNSLRLLWFHVEPDDQVNVPLTEIETTSSISFGIQSGRIAAAAVGSVGGIATLITILGTFFVFFMLMIRARKENRSRKSELTETILYDNPSYDKDKASAIKNKPKDFQNPIYEPSNIEHEIELTQVVKDPIHEKTCD